MSTVTRKPRKNGRRGADRPGDAEALLEAFARRIERGLERQEERLRLQGDSYDAVRRAHDDVHRRIDKRLDDLERDHDAFRATLTKVEVLLEQVRAELAPISILLDRVRSAHPRATHPPPHDETSTEPRPAASGA